VEEDIGLSVRAAQIASKDVEDTMTLSWSSAAVSGSLCGK